MRNFQLFSIIVFLVFYSILSFGAIKSLSKIISAQNVRKSFVILISIFIFLFTGFLLLYVWPLTTRNIKGYTIHLIYNALLSVDFVFKFSLTLSYLTGILFSNKSKHVIYYMGFILSVGISSSVIFGTLFGRNNVVVNNIELGFNNLPESFNGLKVLQISDTHLGGFMGSKHLLNKVIRITEEINPDLIFFTGDLVNNFSTELEGWENVFKKFTNNRDCYSILGNHDYGNYSNWENDSIKKVNFNQIVQAHQSFGFKLLNNNHVVLKSLTDSIFVIGVENWGHPPFPQYANLDLAINKIPENSFKILLSHDPAHWEEVIKEKNNIDLTLSGHTHGFQWGIKKAGITFSLSYFVRNNWGGLYKFNNSYLYVNTGLGTVGIPWRINMPGEITVLTLKRIKID